jgi:flavin reductase (DIM6/NTAB) family NADH-FMN oxidoreductase RutF
MTATISIAPNVFYFGTPVVLLSTLMPDGATNITPLSSAWALGATYVVGLGVDNQGTANLERTGEAVINLPDAGLTSKVERIAATTGSPDVPASKAERYRHEPDKWRLGGFSPLPSRRVRPARIAECPVQMEAELTDLVEIQPGSVAAHLRVVETHAHESLVLPGSQHIDLERWRPVYYTFRHYFAQGERVGVSFKAEQ